MGILAISNFYKTIIISFIIGSWCVNFASIIFATLQIY